MGGLGEVGLFSLILLCLFRGFGYIYKALFFPAGSVKIRAVFKISEGDLAIATQAMVACRRLTRQGQREPAGKLLRELHQIGELKESQQRPRNHIAFTDIPEAPIKA